MGIITFALLMRNKAPLQAAGSGGRAFEFAHWHIHSKVVGTTNQRLRLIPKRAIFSDGNRRVVEPTVEHESLPPTPGSTQEAYAR